MKLADPRQIIRGLTRATAAANASCAGGDFTEKDMLDIAAALKWLHGLPKRNANLIVLTDAEYEALDKMILNTVPYRSPLLMGASWWRGRVRDLGGGSALRILDSALARWRAVREEKG